MRVKAFPALVPAPGMASRIASVPYDVVSTAEAREQAGDNPDSYLRVVRADLEFPDGTDPYGDEIYERSEANFSRLRGEGLLVREPEPCLYLYRQVMGSHMQTGVTLVCHVEDYENDLIKKHEKTRQAKEDDRTRLTDRLSANTGPVFLTYLNVAAVDRFVEDWTASREAGVDFVDPAGVRHQVWRLTEGEGAPVLKAFEKVPVSYVADGHHRSASAARVARERREANPRHDGTEDYNWFMAVMFPSSQLQVLPYNRVVKGLRGLSADGFLQRLSETVRLDSNGRKRPESPGSACLYLDGHWHQLRWEPPLDAGPAERLDVAILQERVLGPLLGIGDPRTDERVDFVGGIRGTEELERRVNGGEWAAAFSMHPTTVGQLMDIADAGEIMLPKSTWFEPKLRSGLFVHTFG